MQYGVNPKLATCVSQDHLRVALTRLFPNTLIHVKHSVTKGDADFDFWIPTHNLCVEFEDPYKYMTSWLNYTPTQRQQLFIDDRSDAKLLENAITRDLTLVVVPCWWDGSPEGLAATIQFSRPDLTFEFGHPTPLNPPQGYLLSPELPDVGELMLASSPTKTNFIVQSANWWMGEKYDGIRACWNSRTQNMYTHSGRELQLPPQILKRMPKHFLDGEFWFGRGNFDLACFLATGSPALLDARLMRYIAFDIPARSYQKLPFEERYKLLLGHTFQAHPFVQVAPMVSLQGPSHLNWTVQLIGSAGGDGLILHKMKSRYINGRSSSLLQLKTPKLDSEALVVGKNHENTLFIKLQNGTTASVPASHIYISMPDIGSVVSYFYERFLREGDTAQPIVYRVRPDVSWDTVSSPNFENDFYNESLKALNISPISPTRISIANMRMFMEDFAKSRNLDPLLPSTWYNIPYADFYSHKGARAVLQKFNGGFYHALLTIFPEIGLNAKIFQEVVWADIGNRKKFLELYSRNNGFNPLLPENWNVYMHRASNSTKEIWKTILSYHRNSVVQALVDLFPTFNSKWATPESRREFFVDYARAHNFDPLDAESWYNQFREAILYTEGARDVIAYHENSLKSSLVELFPEVPFIPSKLALFGEQERHVDADTIERTRLFLSKVARDVGLDPLVPDTWKSINRIDVFKPEGGFEILRPFRHSLKKALLAVYPDIGLDFSHESLNTTRSFFEKFARDQQFDPHVPSNWYCVTFREIRRTKGGPKILIEHGSLPNAVISAFPELHFNVDEFQTKQQILSHKEFFDSFAKAHNFDPNVAKNWDSIPRDTITSFKGGFIYTNLNLTNILRKAYPELAKANFSFKRSRSPEAKREFFIEYAKAHNFDPLVAENWYSQTRKDLLAAKGAWRINALYTNGFATNLVQVFPEIKFDEKKLSNLRISLENKKHKYWENSANAREFFDNFARERGSDPLQASSWYSVHKKQLFEAGGSTLINYHFKGSVKSALEHVYPEIDWDQSKFYKVPLYYWKQAANRKKFLDEFAKSRNFDPLIPDNWYPITYSDIEMEKGGIKVLEQHNYSLTEAVKALYPNMKLDEDKMLANTRRWQHKTPREFFEKFAHSKNFDPLVPMFWYATSIYNTEGSEKAKNSFVTHFKKNTLEALLEAFPDIGLQRAHIYDKRKYWHGMTRRKMLFQEIAKFNNFNPLDVEKWYKLPPSHYQVTDYLVKRHYEGSYIKALIDIFPKLEFDESKFAK